MTEPDHFRLLARYGKLPVPFVTAIIDGRPDFRVHDDRKRKLCALHGLCQLCGEKLGDTMVFAGLGRSLDTRTFGEPPMHPECLEWAWDVCPWLAGRNWRAEWKNAAAEVEILRPTTSYAEDVGVLTTNGYRMVPDPERPGHNKWLANPPLVPVEWRTRATDPLTGLPDF